MRLQVKDIAESLGKLPAQAVEIEETVLAAIILEKQAIKKVVKLLHPEHFYTESHQEVYKAILSLHAHNKPIDMRSVVHELKSTGKLELVGGHFFIAELTTKANSSENLEYHSQIIIECYIKREIAIIGARLNQKGFEDGADPLQVLDENIEKLQLLKEKSINEPLEEKIKTLWKERMVVEQPPDEEVLISIDQVPVATVGNHSLLTGKKKSRKSLFIVWLAKLFFKQNNAVADEMMLFDTEQGKPHVWKILKKIKKITGFDIPVFFLRGMSPKDRRDFILNTIKMWKKKPKMIIIDGIRDLMSNINDADETTELIVWLEDITIHYHIHIINVLHLNKTDDNARGHIGTELANKAEITYELKKDEEKGCTIVRCESSRERDFDTFAFTHGVDELPEVLGTPIKGSSISVDQRKKLLIAAFEEGAMKYADVINELKAQFDVGKSKAESLLREFQRMGWIVKSGAPRDPKALYKLMISENGHDAPPPIEEPIQQQQLQFHEEEDEPLPF
jgi:hypothetical protein